MMTRRPGSAVSDGSSHVASGCLLTCAAPACRTAVCPAAGNSPGRCAAASPAGGCSPAAGPRTPCGSAPAWPSSWPQSRAASRSPSACLRAEENVQRVKPASVSACVSRRRSAFFTSGPDVELLLQLLVLPPQESNLFGQLTLLLVAVDEDVGGS